ncbi:MAG: hypothetical protein AB7V25_00325 [Mangrovibacterium sp.]
MHISDQSGPIQVTIGGRKQKISPSGNTFNINAGRVPYAICELPADYSEYVINIFYASENINGRILIKNPGSKTVKFGTGITGRVILPGYQSVAFVRYEKVEEVIYIYDIEIVDTSGSENPIIIVVGFPASFPMPLI